MHSSRRGPAPLADASPRFVADGRQGAKEASTEWPQRQEFRGSYRLSPNASVPVVNVPFGAVVIEPTDDEAVLVHLVRSARTCEELVCNRFGLRKVH